MLEISFYYQNFFISGPSNITSHEFSRIVSFKRRLKFSSWSFICRRMQYSELHLFMSVYRACRGCPTFSFICYMTEIPKIKFGCRNQLTPGEGAHQIGINRIRLKILSVECFLSDKKLFIICNLVSSDIWYILIKEIQKYILTFHVSSFELLAEN